MLLLIGIAGALAAWDPLLAQNTLDQSFGSNVAAASEASSLPVVSAEKVATVAETAVPEKINITDVGVNSAPLTTTTADSPVITNLETETLPTQVSAASSNVESPATEDALPLSTSAEALPSELASEETPPTINATDKTLQAVPAPEVALSAPAVATAEEESSATAETLPAAYVSEDVAPTAEKTLAAAPIAQETLPAAQSTEETVPAAQSTEETLPAVPATLETLPADTAAQETLPADTVAQEALPADTAAQETLSAAPSTEETLPVSLSAEETLQVAPATDEVLPVASATQETEKVDSVTEKDVSIAPDSATTNETVTESDIFGTSGIPTISDDIKIAATPKGKYGLPAKLEFVQVPEYHQLPKAKKFIVFSDRRSGTTWLGDILHQHPQVSYHLFECLDTPASGVECDQEWHQTPVLAQTLMSTPNVPMATQFLSYFRTPANMTWKSNAGFKVMAETFYENPERLHELVSTLKSQKVKVVALRRYNQLRKCVSSYDAKMRRNASLPIHLTKYSAVTWGTEKLKIPPEYFSYCLDRYDALDKMIDLVTEVIPSLHLSYTKLCKDKINQLERVHRYVNMPMPFKNPESTFVKIHKQPTVMDMVENWAEVQKYLLTTHHSYKLTVKRWHEADEC
ncbi:hypothetical protein AAMO2058_001274000 [Amorphochlora amoebiformis]